MWYGGPGTWIGWLVMMFMMVLFWGGLIVLVVWLVRTSRWGAGPDAGRTSDAASILRERFARGEIDADEFNDRMRVLEGGSPTRSNGGPAST